MTEPERANSSEPDAEPTQAQLKSSTPPPASRPEGSNGEVPAEQTSEEKVAAAQTEVIVPMPVLIRRDAEVLQVHAFVARGVLVHGVKEELHPDGRA